MNSTQQANVEALVNMSNIALRENTLRPHLAVKMDPLSTLRKKSLIPNTNPDLLKLQMQIEEKSLVRKDYYYLNQKSTTARSSQLSFSQVRRSNLKYSLLGIFLFVMLFFLSFFLQKEGIFDPYTSKLVSIFIGFCTLLCTISYIYFFSSYFSIKDTF